MKSGNDISQPETLEEFVGDIIMGSSSWNVIGSVRYFNILTRLQGFRVKMAIFVWLTRSVNHNARTQDIYYWKICHGEQSACLVVYYRQG